MSELEWFGVAVLVLATLIPVAVWFGIQIGMERMR